GPDMCGGVDEIELTWTNGNRHRRACRMTSESAMSGPTPNAYGSSSNCSMRRRRVATNSNAPLTVSFFLVVPSSLAASSSASSFRSIIVFMCLKVLPDIHARQHRAVRWPLVCLLAAVDRVVVDQVCTRGVVSALRRQRGKAGYTRERRCV